MSGRLKGKTALITGAATGMGRATALRFAQEGGLCVLFSLGGNELTSAASETGGIAVHGDVTKAEDIARAAAALPAFDILVNAAGIHTPDDPHTIEDATWDRMFAVNVTGAMAITRAVLPGMMARRSGAIVNIASVGAFNATPGGASYAASKAALVAFTRATANTYGAYGIRANAVAPGWVRTPMSEREMDEFAAANGTTREAEFSAMAARIALGRIATAAEIANCCLFLASDEASFVTGAVLVADGGGRVAPAMRAV